MLRHKTGSTMQKNFPMSPQQDNRLSPDVSLNYKGGDWGGGSKQQAESTWKLSQKADINTRWMFKMIMNDIKPLCLYICKYTCKYVRYSHNLSSGQRHISLRRMFSKVVRTLTDGRLAPSPRKQVNSFYTCLNFGLCPEVCFHFTS